MAVRSTMQTNIIPRVRLLINDPGGTSEIFHDQDIQDVLDASRQDIGNAPLTAYPTYTAGTLKYLDFYHDLGDWEDGAVLKQYLTVLVTPSVSEPIVGHWEFTANTYPPVFITGSTHDVYRAAADLLERWAAKWVLNFDFSSDSQSFKRSQAADMLQKLAHTYRLKQRAITIQMTRSDIASGQSAEPSLKAREIDYMASG